MAAGFASGVSEPGVSSIGGGGFLLAAPPDGPARLIDFFTAVPSGTHAPPQRVTVQYSGATQDFNVGVAAVAVPGGLDGLLHAHRRLGRLPLADVVAPAAQFARDGVRLEPAQAHAMGLIDSVLTLTADARARMAPHGLLLRSGEVFADAELADLLDAVAAGHITGIADLAQPFRQLMPDGPITPEDLRAYKVVDRDPLVAGIGQGSITTNPMPSLGGSIVAHVLRDLSGNLHPEPVQIAEALVETTSWLKSQVVSSAGTTHISVVDGEGMSAALTLSNGVGGGVFLPGTGIHLNNMMGEDDLHPAGAQAATPGERIRSMMAPSVVDFDRGRLVLGTGGSERIRSALTRVITLVLGGDADLAGAVEAPRVHVDNQGIIQVEPGLAAAQLAALGGLGEVSRWPARHFYFGGVNAVLMGTDGELTAYADPRRGGAALVL